MFLRKLAVHARLALVGASLLGGGLVAHATEKPGLRGNVAERIGFHHALWRYALGAGPYQHDVSLTPSALRQEAGLLAAVNGTGRNLTLSVGPGGLRTASITDAAGVSRSLNMAGESETTRPVGDGTRTFTSIRQPSPGRPTMVTERFTLGKKGASRALRRAMAAEGVDSHVARAGDQVTMLHTYRETDLAPAMLVSVFRTEPNGARRVVFSATQLGEPPAR